MKFSKEVLLEIVFHVQDGLLRSKDISENLRKMDVMADENGELVLSQDYKSAYPREAIEIDSEEV